MAPMITEAIELEHSWTAPEKLRSSEEKALLEFRAKLEAAIITQRLLKPPLRRPMARTRVAHSSSGDLSFFDREDFADVTLWGVPLLPSKGHEGTDVILLKFLRAREFKVGDAFEMLQRNLRWRKEFGADGILEEEELGSPEIESAAHMGGVDKEGHPVCYNAYGVFRDEEVYERTFGDEGKRERYLRWRVQLMERGIKQLAFKPKGVASMVQIIDLKNSLSPAMKEMHATTKKAVSILQDNYPEFIAKNIFINVSLRYYVYHAMFSQLTSQRSKSKFMFIRPHKVTETLLKFIAPEHLPVSYGGMKREEDDEFTTEDRVRELSIKGGSTTVVKIPAPEPGVTIVWDLTVVGWDVSYKEEFVPDDEGSYRVLIQEEKQQEECARNSFYISEPGRILLTVENRAFKKKKVIYRSKSKRTIPLYNLRTNSGNLLCNFFRR